ncbi:methyltransferase domain-containing protein [Yoonia litorea]|uniref:Methyltransferase domain-containing protein n=1 Tax=Yoonia litorea TaxID=1123755 RepID=A0A1I6MUS2_9RHOB|nr:methyltransferase domain-containing protein [Yoonia litorea]SFS19460.1 Methyltransferase domain-containing protein [Yoonia litorea]
MLKFDAEVTRLLDNAYQGADLTRRRQASFDVLQPSPGETILDIGCGNGLLTAELARAVGQSGSVIGIDPSEDMRTVGVLRCKDYPWVKFLDGFANEMPVEDAVADKAVSVQTFEYIEDIESAVTDAMRCLKPKGRLVISDLHFGSFIWFSDNPERMATLIASWDQHFVAGDLPARLPGIIRSLGHHIDAVNPVTLTDHILKPDGIAIMMMHLMRQYAITNEHVAVEVADAWFDEQISLAKEGRFFFSITQFVVSARKSG